MKFLIAGDLVVNKEYDADNNIDSALVKFFSNSDCNIINLEAPVTNSNIKIIKTGPHLKAVKNSTLNVIKKLNINYIALANNHIKDYGEEGVVDTIKFCEENYIKTIGAGKNSEIAAETKILDTPEGKIALINIAENEWSSAEENTAGANGMNLIKDIRKIQEAKNNSDFVFVIIHGGHEYYNLPSPRIKEQYRFYIEQGADLVVSHHTHCISGYELYKGKYIYYGLGNFLFTHESKYEEWYKGLVLEVVIENKQIRCELHPISQSKNNYLLSLLDGSEKKLLIEEINNLSEIIQNHVSLQYEWKKFVSQKKVFYLNYFSPLSFVKSRYIKAILRRLHLTFINKPGLSLLLNLIRCEAHHDVSKAVIKDYLEK
ncbi:CapA family protein [Acinetobacter pseudolwoffii]|uniref:CapA family protein n=1 Tax=Acinetobacter pseudolwoffii TaxID=2053287 RepID=UPI002578E708|nr:CapA family protein [Acinetobacter pseudolwoffii]MDM1344685.1 CapA family protein [Acinetobacter pseudolwoffii]